MTGIERKVELWRLNLLGNRTVTLYALTDMEYSRLGLIRIENFDHFLVDAHQQMQARGGPGIIRYGR
jgi:hypothetical protein